MSTHGKWFFTKEQLMNSPSRKHGYDSDRELCCRQHAANLIQDMGQRLQLTLLCINTAIVYMHRFYVFHSLSVFHRNSISVSALFLAAKIEEQPRKLEHVIKAAHVCLFKDGSKLDTNSQLYLEQVEELLFNENVLLQTLGFDLRVDHPHPFILQCCDAIKAGKDLAQTAYILASHCWHLTMMCLQYSPKIIASICIYIACKCLDFQIPQLKNGKDWYKYLDNDVTLEVIQKIAQEFLEILRKCPNKFRNKTLYFNKGKQPLKVPSALMSDSLHKVLEDKSNEMISSRLDNFVNNWNGSNLNEKTEITNQYYKFSENTKAVHVPSHSVPKEVVYNKPEFSGSQNLMQNNYYPKRKYETSDLPSINAIPIDSNVNFNYNGMNDDSHGQLVLNESKRFKYY